MLVCIISRFKFRSTLFVVSHEVNIFVNNFLRNICHYKYFAIFINIGELPKLIRMILYIYNSVFLET